MKPRYTGLWWLRIRQCFGRRMTQACNCSGRKVKTWWSDRYELFSSPTCRTLFCFNVVKKSYMYSLWQYYWKRRAVPASQSIEPLKATLDSMVLLGEFTTSFNFCFVVVVIVRLFDLFFVLVLVVVGGEVFLFFLLLFFCFVLFLVLVFFFFGGGVCLFVWLFVFSNLCEWYFSVVLYT